MQPYLGCNDRPRHGHLRLLMQGTYQALGTKMEYGEEKWIR